LYFHHYIKKPPKYYQLVCSWNTNYLTKVIDAVKAAVKIKRRPSNIGDGATDVGKPPEFTTTIISPSEITNGIQSLMPVAC
jgi:hypothetical protein